MRLIIMFCPLDGVVLDGDGRVSGAYPFTDAPSEHQVEAAGITMGAMCALDALGICTIAPHASLIRSSCRQCRRSLAIHVHDRGCTLGDVVPEGILVWSGHRYTGGCAASSLCTQQAFFCHADHLEAWRMDGSVTARDGIRLTLREALQVGRAIFAPMLGGILPWPITT